LIAKRSSGTLSAKSFISILPNWLKTVGGIMIAILLTYNGKAQLISETQWFFGQSTANLQFDKNGQMVYEEDRMNASFGTGGPAVVSDPFNGNLLFYSDGTQIYDASHAVMTGGSGLNGNPVINQSAVVVPVPGSSGRFYLFTNGCRAAIDEIQFSEVYTDQVGNGSADAPLGAVLTSSLVTGLTNPSEGMIILKGADDLTYWLLSQERSTYDFHVTEITSTGLGATQVFALDTAISIPGSEIGQFAYNADSSLIAAAPRDANRNILLLNFSDSTGVLSVNRQIRNTGFNDDGGENVYDVEWSQDGSKLYMSRYGATTSSTANIYQIDMGDSLLRSVPIVTQSYFRGFGLKRGIDNNIYHLFQTSDGSPTQVARLSNVDSVASIVGVEMPYFETDFAGTQFPSFADPNLSSTAFTVEFTYLDSCENNVTKFFPRVSPLPNNYLWIFGDGSISTEVAPIHQYPSATTYTARLLVELNGVIGSSAPTAVTYLPNSDEVDLGADTVICVDEILTLPQDPFQNATSFLWSTGETTSSINVDTTGTYWVEVTFAGGCTGFDAVEVTEYGISRSLSNQWYFGEMAGLDFNIINGLAPPPRAITDANQMFSEEGCASISDSDGQLLFYTNGRTVWNRNHDVMPVLDPTAISTSLGGDSTASQGTLILPFMDDETMFYIFTAEEVYGDGQYDIKYAIVDMKKESANGAIILKDLVLAEDMAEKITASSFNVSSWLVTHGFGNNNFRTHLVSDRGIESVIHTPIGEVLDAQFPEQASGSMKFNVGVTNFANVIPGPNQIELFDFNFNTGRFDNSRLIETNETSNLYGLEFSGGGTKLYVTTPGSLIQYDLDSLGATTEIDDIINSKFDTYSVTGTLGAIQRASNGILYIATDGGSSIKYISSPDGDDAQALLNDTGVDLGGRVSRLGLPNFTQNISAPSQSPGFTFVNACLGQETDFFATGSSTIDEFFWTFDTAALFPTDYGQNVTTTYSSSGFKPVQLNIVNRCATDRLANGPNPALSALSPPYSIDTILYDTVEVFTIPEQPIIPDEVNLCGADSLALELWFEDRDDLHFYWEYYQNGALLVDTNRVFVAYDALGDLRGAIANDDGCTSDTVDLFIGDNRPFLDLGLDQIYCQNVTAPDVDAGVTGVSYQWWINEVEVANLDTARVQLIDTSQPATYEYVVKIREPFFNCTALDTLEVTIKEAPAALGNATSPTICGAFDGELNFEITTSGAFLYDISGDSLSDVGSLDGPDTSATYTGLGRGLYTLELENIVTGCTSTIPLYVEDDVPFDLTASNLPDCIPDVDLLMTLSGTQLPDFVSIYITDEIGDTVFIESETTVPINVFPGLADGLYNVFVTDRDNGCQQADSVLIEPLYADDEICEPVIQAPNAFTPNGNGQNDEFFVYPGAFVDKFEIFIYSRWGELVYYSDEKDFRWDGVFQGQVVPPGTVTFVIKFTSLEQPELGTLTQYGAVTVIR
jgi:gliding motility-associated-like protein